ncbi:hypothetical protein PLICRDRAFT_347224 [Plicaturopsis crispa FD-325 SS-3]|uniref:C2H2-type domain-containing protein n=1 Tax=Plicaturopsis crispa FD-325 SS-3 TaxID=944288 RepID=A0A0C9SYB0_PLICR|nr:hypothetical protein PLICRDRAFT_347224 [Plicaturopsis crispa FD-325 SS-3]
MNSTTMRSICDVDGVSRAASDDKYHCPTCDTAFTRRSNLRRHYAIHTRNLDFKCEGCNKAFARRVSRGSDQLRFHAPNCPLLTNGAADTSAPSPSAIPAVGPSTWGASPPYHGSPSFHSTPATLPPNNLAPRSNRLPFGAPFSHGDVHPPPFPAYTYENHRPADGHVSRPPMDAYLGNMSSPSTSSSSSSYHSPSSAGYSDPSMIYYDPRSENPSATSFPPPQGYSSGNPLTDIPFNPDPTYLEAVCKIR